MLLVCTRQYTNPLLTIQSTSTHKYFYYWKILLIYIQMCILKIDSTFPLFAKIFISNYYADLPVHGEWMAKLFGIKANVERSSFD